MSNSDKEIERLLKQEETQLSRQQEVERVLSASTLDPFDILQVAHTCTPSEIKVAYRIRSRLIHPDKTDHEKAREAFEKLKKAETELMDDEKRKSITAMMDEAKRELAAEWRAQTASGARKQDEADESSEEFRKAALAKYKAIMVDIEWRRRQKLKQEMAAEGAAATKREESAKEVKRKRDADKAWEDGREARVNSWRSFQASSKGKKKDGKKAKKAASAAVSK
ncbi:DnaJ-domain-containing protein [Martensiomyces pterosporus]|nr:DnaJ-domain-containing protein [Martensiomyces pterosporus]